MPQQPQRRRMYAVQPRGRFYRYRLISIALFLPRPVQPNPDRLSATGRLVRSAGAYSFCPPLLSAPGFTFRKAQINARTVTIIESSLRLTNQHQDEYCDRHSSRSFAEAPEYKTLYAAKEIRTFTTSGPYLQSLFTCTRVMRFKSLIKTELTTAYRLPCIHTERVRHYFPFSTTFFLT